MDMCLKQLDEADGVASLIDRDLHKIAEIY